VADQAGQGTLTDGTGAIPAVSSPGHEDGGHNSGRPISWVGVAVTTIGFIVGGVAMVPDMRWWLFWVGTGIAVVGCFILAVVRTLELDWY
jgi:hypothetical protein